MTIGLSPLKIEWIQATDTSGYFIVNGLCTCGNCGKFYDARMFKNCPKCGYSKDESSDLDLQAAFESGLIGKIQLFELIEEFEVAWNRRERECT